jgi:hypothetical protein
VGPRVSLDVPIPTEPSRHQSSDNAKIGLSEVLGREKDEELHNEERNDYF